MSEEVSGRVSEGVGEKKHLLLAVTFLLPLRLFLNFL